MNAYQDNNITTRHSTQSSMGPLLLYAILISVSLLSLPKTSISGYVTHITYVMEILSFMVLFYRQILTRIKISAFNVHVTLWWILYVLIAYAQHTTTGFMPIFLWLNITIILLIGNLYWKDNFEIGLKHLSILFGGLVYLNAILLILFPEGLWIDNNWVGRGSPVRYLFGNLNQTGFVCLLAIATHSVYTFHTHRGYLSLCLLVVVSLGSVIFLGSKTSLVCLLLYTTFLICHRAIKRPTLVLLLGSFVYVLFFILIIWQGSSIETYPLITRFIENTLQKDITFSERTSIWSNAVYTISLSPFIGHGIQGMTWNDEHLGGSGPHNLWLMILLQGGFTLCLYFIGIIVYTLKLSLKTTHTPNIAASFALCTLLIMSLFETYNIVFIFFLIQITYYTTTLTKKLNN